MTIYSADLQPVHPVSYLWALPAVPAVAAAVLALAGRALERRFGRRAVGSAVALTGCAAAALLVVLADDAVLALVAWEALVWTAFVLVPRAAHGTPEAADSRRLAVAFAVNRAGQAAWLGALVLLFWGLGDGPSRVTADVRGVPGGGIELRTQGDRPPEASVRELAVGPT